jgi:hypothetical protein
MDAIQPETDADVDAKSDEPSRRAPRQSQGKAKAVPSRQKIVIEGTLGPRDQASLVLTRVVRVIASGVRLGPWWGFPGAVPWWLVRRQLGGRVGAQQFRTAVDVLLAAGRVIEVWLEPLGLKDPSHVLLLPKCSGALRRPIAMARGRADVLRAEPWFARLEARAAEHAKASRC